MKEVQTRLERFGSVTKSENIQLIPKSYTGIYSMHKYWSKKPFNLINQLIEKYSDINDVILDPFCGSGISIVEATLTHRKAIGIDINPAAIFITHEMLVKFRSNEIEIEFKRILNDCKKAIDDLYKVERKSQSFTGTHFVWAKDELKEVWYIDERGKKIVDTSKPSDVKQASSFSYENIPYYYPKSKLFHNSRINAKSKMHVYDLFTPRNTHALSLLMHKIEGIKNLDLQNLFKFCFTATLGQASKMVFVINKRGKFNGQHSQDRKEVGSWIIGYWIPKENFEINVWNCFENRYRRILKAKKEQYDFDYDLMFTNNFKGLKDANLFLINDSALTTMKQFPDDSIDYIITDPPHGNRLPYLELSMMWNDWLKNKVNYDDEIVVSEARDRGKDLENYNILLGKVISEIDRVLKPKHYFTLMFNSLDDETWLNLLAMVKDLRLELHDIGTMGYSANSVVQDNRQRGLKTDFVLTFKKVKDTQNSEISFLQGETAKNQIKLLIENFLVANTKLETYQILNYVITNSLKEKKFFKLTDVLDVIDSNFKEQIKQLNPEAH